MDNQEYIPDGSKYLPDDLISRLWDKTKSYVSGYVSQHPGSTTPGEIPETYIATDEEVAEMLDDVFSSVGE